MGVGVEVGVWVRVRIGLRVIVRISTQVKRVKIGEAHEG